ncbi:hypothetical protein [Cellulosilyticum lentocellum]|uniref:DZANK-type domain-containing protein n=1 Tax=Cellulosilyticum lentocellum (strain ATCC 49066 / DSM 5427 / NCIMB 11756 / RHM5) TaxID=642492 RepID=F2JK79_CELLD|nr:hypothetical protein [Cellulosilyticum lentocellum]ADZ84494.1 hypothetical protein Clole_2795 [Cellulosilyticum lentocellum DSM 5427]
MKCPNCGFEKHIEHAEFCQECGTFMINFCSNPVCNMNNGEELPLSNDMKFCPDCGQPSTFKANGFFDKK